jgi:segregation and condensation protein B
MDDNEIKYFLEAALLAAGRPLSIDQLQGLFDGRMAPEKQDIRKIIARLNEEYEPRGIIVSEVASGFRMQVKSGMADRLQKLWEERPPRYSRALFETLALIAYRQPITRGEIEEIRGVAVSSNITRQLLERDWVRVVGHRDVPGRPSMFGTTKGFLDYFSLKKLDDLPPLADLADWEALRVQLNLPDVEGTDGSSEIVGEIEGLAALSVDGSGEAIAEEIGEEAEEASEEEANAEAEEDTEVLNSDFTDSDAANGLPVLHPEGEDEPADVAELAASKWPEPDG